MPKEKQKPEKELLKASFANRRASLSEAEAYFLRALLIDEAPPCQESLRAATKVLSDDMLFSVPSKDLGIKNQQKMDRSKARRPPTLALWKAHQDGVHPRKLAEKGALCFEKPQTVGEAVELMKEKDEQKIEVADSLSDASDAEVRNETKHDDDCSSWDEADHKDHYDAWEVLKDEYAEDFGCDYNEKVVSVDEILGGNDQNSFLILGASVDDHSSHPHVLSPPLMDALMNNFPQALRSTNYWLKYSLVRDGANLETLIRYCRASPSTVLAVETPRGEVFGCFTSSPWRIHRSYFGCSPSFVWKMRHSRRTVCASLFDQAQLESHVDDYSFCGEGELVQVCRHDVLAVGGDGIESDKDLNGFAFSLDSDLLRGTTGPCSSFKSPSLCGSEPDVSCMFDIANIEVWTLTSCRDVPAAERLEMTQFFRTESSKSVLTNDSSQFSTKDLTQDKFYQRVGEDTESEERRQRWEYANMMSGETTAGGRGFGASPRFG